MISKQIIADDIIKDLVHTGTTTLFLKVLILIFLISIGIVCFSFHHWIAYAVGALLFFTAIAVIVFEFYTWFRLYPTLKHQRFRILEDTLVQISPEEFQGMEYRRNGVSYPVYEDVFWFADYGKFFVTGTNLVQLSNVGDRFYLLIYDSNPKEIIRIYSQKFYRLEE